MGKIVSDYKSGFRTPKKGKISLGVVALLTTVTIGQAVAPDPIVVDTHITEFVALSTSQDLNVTPSGYIDVNFPNVKAVTTMAGYSGDITIDGKIRTDSYAIFISGDNSGSITNNGIITYYSTSGASAGIRVSDNSGTIRNDGNITVSGNGITLTDNTGEIINNGTIKTLGYSNGIFVEKNDGNITNSGTVDAKSSIYIRDSSSTGTLVNEESGILNGNIFIKGGFFTNKGTINITDTAGWSNINKGFLQTTDGTLSIALDITSATTSTNSYIKTLGGDVALEDGSTINVNVSGDSGVITDWLADGSDINITVFDTSNGANPDGNITANVDQLNITDNSALLNFEPFLLSNIFGLTAVEAKTFLDSTIAGGGATPERAAAVALDVIKNGSFPQMAMLIGRLRSDFATDAEVANAVSSLTPQAGIAAVGAAGQIANGIQGIVEMRQNVGFSGLNSGDKFYTDQYLWMKPYGSFGEQDDKDGINGFDLNAYGLGIGTDAEYAPNHKAGLAFFITKANVETNNVVQEADLDVYTLLGYGSMPVIDDKTNFLYQVGYSWQKTDTSRTLFDATVAKADFTSKTASIDLKLVRNYDVASNWMLQPLVELTYRNYSTPAYSENGSSGDLNLAKSTSEEFIASLGVISYYKLNDISKLTSHVNVGYDFMDDDITSVAEFTNATGVEFTSNAIDNGRWSYELGVGYELDLNKDSNLNFSVDYQAEGSDYASTSVSAKYLLKF
jgi:outer membrane autotransporter protein